MDRIMKDEYKNLKMVPRMVFGRGCFNQLNDILAHRRENGHMLFLVDDVFEGTRFKERLPLQKKDQLEWVNVDEEPSTELIDSLRKKAREHLGTDPSAVIGIGGGSVMDTAKAVSIMLTNPGSSAGYQGWDLVENRAVYHVGVPTISGTGAEVSRTAVLTGPLKKLGINSDYTVFDQIILDPDLIGGVPPDQRFYTGMDCYIHCVESLRGKFINTFSRAYAEKAMDICREIFLEEWKKEYEEKLMMASLFGGMSITYSQVGVCHALSYGLAYVLKVHHGIGNSLVFYYLDDFYPKEVDEFKMMCKTQGIKLPKGITKGISESALSKMVDIALTLEPLWENAMGPDWKKVMTRDRLNRLYEMM